MFQLWGHLKIHRALQAISSRVPWGTFSFNHVRRCQSTCHGLNALKTEDRLVLPWGTGEAAHWAESLTGIDAERALKSPARSSPLNLLKKEKERSPSPGWYTSGEQCQSWGSHSVCSSLFSSSLRTSLGTALTVTSEHSLPSLGGSLISWVCFIPQRGLDLTKPFSEASLGQSKKANVPVSQRV